MFKFYNLLKEYFYLLFLNRKINIKMLIKTKFFKKIDLKS